MSENTDNSNSVKRNNNPFARDTMFDDEEDTAMEELLMREEEQRQKDLLFAASQPASGKRSVSDDQENTSKTPKLGGAVFQPTSPQSSIESSLFAKPFPVPSKNTTGHQTESTTPSFKSGGWRDLFDDDDEFPNESLNFNGDDINEDGDPKSSYWNTFSGRRPMSPIMDAPLSPILPDDGKDDDEDDFLKDDYTIHDEMSITASTTSAKRPLSKRESQDSQFRALNDTCDSLGRGYVDVGRGESQFLSRETSTQHFNSHIRPDMVPSGPLLFSDDDTEAGISGKERVSDKVTRDVGRQLSQMTSEANLGENTRFSLFDDLPEDDEDEDMMALEKPTGTNLRNRLLSSSQGNQSAAKSFFDGFDDTQNDGGDLDDEDDLLNQNREKRLRPSAAHINTQASSLLSNIHGSSSPLTSPLSSPGRPSANTSRANLNGSNLYRPKPFVLPKRNYCVQPLDGTPHLIGTSSTGERLFFPKKRPATKSSFTDTVMKSREETSGSYNPLLPGQQKSLLSTNIFRLMEEIDAERKIARNKQLLDADDDSQLRDILMQINTTNAANNSGPTETQLWVDKYSPKMFGDLLGDGRVLREVMKWVKEWDYCVFGRESTVKKETYQPRYQNFNNNNNGGKYGNNNKGKYGNNNNNNNSSSSSNNNNSNNHNNGKYDNNNNSKFNNNNNNGKFGDFNGPKKPQDYLKRPDRRILLLAGPPGLGKTTLAHVVAKHAGYNIIEVNASDDRTAEALRNKIMGAIEMSTVQNNQPNLVIIDEIDGASAAGGENSFIKMLVDIATAGDGKDSAKDEDGKKKGGPAAGKKNKRQTALRRPIICICNDQYTATLRPLRMISQIFTFRPPTNRALAKRLEEICTREGLKADLRTLMALCEMTEGDIRTALNTLQFFRQRSTVLTLTQLSSLNLGHKDLNKSLFTIWNEIFTQPNAKKMKKDSWRNVGAVSDSNNGSSSNSAASGDGNANAGRYFKRLATLIHGNGEYHKILQGCFEYYLKAPIYDHIVIGDAKTTSAPAALSTPKVLQASEWFYLYDLIDHRIHAKQEWELGSYMTLPFIAMHRLFATPRKAAIEFPRTEYQVYVSTTQHQQVLEQFYKSILPHVRRAWSKKSVLLELSAIIMRILAPEVKSVNMQLLKPAEKKAVAAVVKGMVSLGLTFVQNKTVDGKYYYRMEPPIDGFFERLGSGAGRKQSSLTYNLRQHISQEIDLEIMRRMEKENAKREKARAVRSGEKPAVPKPVLELKPRKLEIKEEKVAKDFFGRVIVIPDATDEDGGSRENRDVEEAAKVWYKFNEGFSNAVRNPLYVRDFL